jgi:hypothetical protein
MAKMFYSSDEAAQKLGVDQARLEEMVNSGELQQFRDRDKVMFKCDQVDALAGGGSAPASSEASASGEDSDVGLSDSSPGQDPSSASGTAIPLEDTGHGTGGETQAPGTGQSSAGSQSGVNVFGPGEVNEEAVDPSEQTQVTAAYTGPPDNQGSDASEEMSIEGVGSGSGLLDLTRESDDTSLGAELLDEIYPAEGEQQQGSSAGSQTWSGGAAAADSSAGSAAGGSAMGGGLAQAGGSVAGAGAVTGGAAQPTRTEAAPEVKVAADPAGDGMSAGVMLGAAIALILGLTVTIAGIIGVDSALAQTMNANFALWMGGLVVLAAVFGLLGMAVGNASAKSTRRG